MKRTKTQRAVALMERRRTQEDLFVLRNFVQRDGRELTTEERLERAEAAVQRWLEREGER